jgi:hypothetical protein
MNNTTVYYVNPNTLVEIDIDAIDKNLVTSFTVDGQFTPNVDTVEVYYYDEGKRLSRYNYNYTAWTSHIDPTLVDTGKLENLFTDPVEDGKVLGVVNGSIYIQYEFVTNKVGSNSSRLFYINSISSDRTEITLKSNDINNVELSGSTAAFIQELDSDTGYFQEFYLNFGENRKEIGVNLQLNNTTSTSPELVIKLYKALPAEFDIKTTLWIQTLLADPVAYKVEYDEIIELPELLRKLRGPNTNLKVAGQSSKSSNYQTYTSLKTTASSSLSNQVDSILAEKGVTLNIDYTDFINFVHFSNAKKRLENFYYKAALLEKYQAGINLVKTTYSSSYRASSLAISESVITDIITNFDGYEYFLYYSSESKAWPKTNSTQPYTLASTGSIQALQWYGSDDLSNPYYGGQIYTASFYDNENQDNLLYSIPEFLREDPNNQPYEIFIEMIGQYFDNLFLYTDQITSKYNADNRLDFGISKDLVADTLRSFGMNIYENNFTTDDLYTALTGLTPSGSLTPLPFITTNYPVTGSGLEYIQTVVSASNEIITLDDLNKSVYKRLYHNLPLLVKKKGTLAGLQLLINSFGIPDTILRINEFGGKDKASNTWDQWQEEYSYKYNTNNIGYVTSSFELNSTWAATNNRPSAVEFRFQTPGIPSANYYSQSLWSTDVGNSLVLKYNGSGSVSGSYSGSIVDPYYQYGVLEFYPSSSNTTTTASIYLPFFDGGWWSVLINKTSATEFTVFAKNKIYNGDTGNILGYEASSSISLTNPWATATKSYFASSSLNLKVFSGSLQELRYYTQPVSKDAFDAYVMNPNSIEQSDYLAFRGALGGELYTGSVSIHPKVSGEQVTTSSFTSNSSYFITSSGYFNSNTETVFYDQVLSGVKNIISSRIRTSNNNGYGVVLSNQISTNQSAPTSTYTPNINYLEVGFSPQNEINEDINSQLGYFNIGEYIGDPRDISNDTTKYPALDKLSLDYFKKYSTSYNFTDYFRLIKFFDNSLFKLIKDFVPARTAAATGAIVKQHLLERNRQRPAQVSYSQLEYTGSVTSVARDYQTGSIGVFTGGAGGSVNTLTNVTQSWSSSILTKAGLVNQINSSQYEFFNGAYSGSSIDVINNKLQDNPLLGSTYRVGIPDLQNLNVSSNAAVSGSGGNLTLPIPFNIQNTVISSYNTTTYEYKPEYSIQSDIKVFVTASVTGSGGSALQSLFLSIREDNNVLGSVIVATIPGGSFVGQISQTLTIPNVYIKAGSTYTANLEEGGAGGFTPITASFNSATTWTVTVDNLYALPTYYLDPTVYTQQNFPGNINNFSDYNSLLNNVYSNRVSDKYYDVDYNTDLLNPVNFQSIISESALYAQVQDSNYSSGSAWSNIRYAGVKLNSKLYNKYTPGDVSYGQTAAVDKYCNYIAQFDWIGGSDPEYPGGGNVHIINLINVDGTVIGLDGSNTNVDTVAQIFKQGDLATAYISSYSSNQSVGAVEIETGGALYDTILFKTGSVTEGFAYSMTVQTATQVNSGFTTALSSSSPWTYVTDSNQGSLFALLTGSSTIGQGKILTISTDYDSSKIYNTKTQAFANTGEYVPYTDTYLPLRYGDFIRFGSGSTKMDSSFTGSSLNRYISASIGSEDQTSALENKLYFSSAINTPIRNTMDSYFDVEYRMMRRVPNETFVLVKNKPQYVGGGLLIPANFNPNYNPIDVARKAGVTL